MLEVYKNPFIWRKKVDLKDAGRLTEERSDRARKGGQTAPRRGLVSRKTGDWMVARGEYLGWGWW